MTAIIVIAATIVVTLLWCCVRIGSDVDDEMGYD